MSCVSPSLFLLMPSFPQIHSLIHEVVSTKYHTHKEERETEKDPHQERPKLCKCVHRSRDSSFHDNRPLLYVFPGFVFPLVFSLSPCPSFRVWIFSDSSELLCTRRMFRTTKHCFLRDKRVFDEKDSDRDELRVLHSKHRLKWHMHWIVLLLRRLIFHERKYSSSKFTSSFHLVFSSFVEPLLCHEVDDDVMSVLESSIVLLSSQRRMFLIAHQRTEKYERQQNWDPKSQSKRKEQTKKIRNIIILVTSQNWSKLNAMSTDTSNKESTSNYRVNEEGNLTGHNNVASGLLFFSWSSWNSFFCWRFVLLFWEGSLEEMSLPHVSIILSGYLLESQSVFPTRELYLITEKWLVLYGYIFSLD